MAGLMKLPFVVERLPLLDVEGNNDTLTRKHALDRTVAPVRELFDEITRLRCGPGHVSG
jgi:hypothetical protein